jgi:hypothetical protein
MREIIVAEFITLDGVIQAPGGWRPNPGADETVNVPYDIGGTRLK